MEWCWNQNMGGVIWIVSTVWSIICGWGWCEVAKGWWQIVWWGKCLVAMCWKGWKNSLSQQQRSPRMEKVRVISRVDQLRLQTIIIGEPFRLNWETNRVPAYLYRDILWMEEILHQLVTFRIPMKHWKSWDDQGISQPLNNCCRISLAHPQSGTFQTFQDLFAAQQKFSCCVYLTLNSTTTELLNQNNREYQTCFHKIPSLSINSVHKLDSLTWSTYGSCFLKGACVRSPSPSESASLKMASMPRLPGPGDLTIRNWNWTDGKIPFSIDEWENSQFFSGKLGISSWDFF